MADLTIEGDASYIFIRITNSSLLVTFLGQNLPHTTRQLQTKMVVVERHPSPRLGTIVVVLSRWLLIFLRPLLWRPPFPCSPQAGPASSFSTGSDLFCSSSSSQTWKRTASIENILRPKMMWRGHKHSIPHRAEVIRPFVPFSVQQMPSIWLEFRKQLKPVVALTIFHCRTVHLYFCLLPFKTEGEQYCIRQAGCGTFLLNRRKLFVTLQDKTSNAQHQSCSKRYILESDWVLQTFVFLSVCMCIRLERQQNSILSPTWERQSSTWLVRN